MATKKASAATDATPDEPLNDPQTDAVETTAATEGESTPSPLMVRLAHGGTVLFHGTKAKLAKRYPGAEIIRYGDGRPYRGEKQV